MSSKVQAWRTPVIEPSGAYSNSLVAVIQTCGCARAGGASSIIKPTSPSSAKSRRVAVSTSGRLGLDQKAAAAQERVGLRLTAAEGDIGLLGIARAAR